jgi:hypothetical protein
VVAELLVVAALEECSTAQSRGNSIISPLAVTQLPLALAAQECPQMVHLVTMVSHPQSDLFMFLAAVAAEAR